jgi:chromosome segregation ATPase
MSQEKFMNHYVDILKSTLNDQVTRNLQLQATAKTQTEIIGEMNTQLTELANQVQAGNAELQATATQREQELTKQIESLKNQVTQVNASKQNDNGNLRNTISELTKKVADLQNSNNELNSKLEQSNRLVNDLKSEVSSLEKELVNVDSLRNQLIATQDMVRDRDSTINDMSQQLDALKTTPAKRTKKTTVVDTPTLETLTEDGGTF